MIMVTYLCILTTKEAKLHKIHRQPLSLCHINSSVPGGFYGGTRGQPICWRCCPCRSSLEQLCCFWIEADRNGFSPHDCVVGRLPLSSQGLNLQKASSSHADCSEG